MNFEIKKITSTQRKVCESSDNHKSVFRFSEEHPLFNYIFLERRKTIVVRQITSSNLLPNVKDLKFGKNEVSHETHL